jgi:hypothetical protein
MALTEALFRNFIKAQTRLGDFRMPSIFPGKKYFGVYRYLPFFFGLGGFLQYKAFKLQEEEEVQLSKILFNFFISGGGAWGAGGG